MLLRQETLRGIEAGRITLAFRWWRRPTVKAGGTLLTAIGQLAIEAVDVVELEEITVAEARDAGMDRGDFKARVRKLKALGLIESLAVGYRLSPRGAAVLRRLESADRG